MDGMLLVATATTFMHTGYQKFIPANANDYLEVTSNGKFPITNRLK